MIGRTKKHPRHEKPPKPLDLEMRQAQYQREASAKIDRRVAEYLESKRTQREGSGS